MATRIVLRDIDSSSVVKWANMVQVQWMGWSNQRWYVRKLFQVLHGSVLKYEAHLWLVRLSIWRIPTELGEGDDWK